MDASSSLVQPLLGWGQEHGTSLAPDVEIYQDPITGLSFRALQNIPPRTKLVICSFQTTLSYLNTTYLSPYFQSHSPPFPPNFVNSLKVHDPNIIGHFFLVQQYLLGTKSFWWHYIRLLPQPDTPEALGLPVWWPEADLEFLNGTNAEPPIKKRKALWEAEWKQGISLLATDFEDREKYTYHLYQWAASIFGSRSFRASLTIPPELISGSQNSFKDSLFILEHIMKDRFSVLLPVMDIGNHNGINQVDWSRDSSTGHFSLSNRELIAQGNQIYNFYGDKSNSELLVAYGFILPGTKRDTVNLRLTPSSEVVQLRRSQTSHVVDFNQPEQEFMFSVRILNDAARHGSGIPQLDMFSPGLVNTMSCMLANNRERRFLLTNPAYSLEKDPEVFSNPMSRNIIFVLRILQDKLNYEISRIEQCGVDLRKPQTQNQHTALEYRNRQVQVLQTAIPPISTILQSAFSYSSFCQHARHSANQSEDSLVSLHSHVELLSLDCAFGWLYKHYPDVTSKVSQLISEDQDEPLPLDWAILVEDWDHTYWTVWIYLVWMLWIHSKIEFETRHVDLAKWVFAMNKSYDDALSSHADAANLHADSTEQETIDFMVQNIAEIPDLVTFPLHQDATERLRNFASFVASEEVLPASCQMMTGSQAGEILEQKLLCISKVGHATRVQEEGSWTTFLSSLTA
ncbi:SET domain-containing protein [Cadophora sp. DSE1049]|nr:SET domain-containing protein [Cadophora sp. DSE1049]